MIKIAIDASRSRSGGAVSHLIGILENYTQDMHGISEIHVWSYNRLLNKLPDCNWLIKHSHPFIERSLIFQIFWQLFFFKKDIVKNECSILLNTSATTFCVFHPSVVMSRDMLSFEPGEMSRYKFSLAWFRLFFLKYIQIYSLIKSDGVIFLTKYAADVIQKTTGLINNFKIIHHGVGDNFKIISNELNTITSKSIINCLYISNTAMYKHQWNVVEAVSMIRKEGFDVNITFIGGGKGKSRFLLTQSQDLFDRKREFTKCLEFVPHNQLPLHLSKADIFIFASSCENMPNTLVEAMSVGLPIACSDRGPMPEILANAGVYFDPENPKSIYNALLILIKNSSIRFESALNSKKLSENFSWKKCSNETFDYVVHVSKTFYS